jgi:hypothetical protein
VETKSLVLAVLETLKVATDINNNITLLPRYKVLCANLLNTVFAFSIQKRSETVSNEETDDSDDDNDDDNDDDVTRVVNFTQNSFLLSILPTAFRTAERVLVRGLLTDITSSVDIASSQAIRHFFINLIAASFETSPSLASPFLSLLFIRLGNLEDYNLVFMHLEKILISSHFAFVRGLALVFEPSVLTEESSNFPLIRLCDSDTEVFHLTRNILTAVIGDSENLSMGRQAKLKKLRQQAKENPPSEIPKSPQETDPKNFVETIEQQGYKLKESFPSPEIPNQDVKPQI